MEQGFHQPVLGGEVVKYLVTDPAGVYVDCTVGGGGHAVGILERLSSAGFLVGLDADAEALAFARERLSGFSNFALRQIFYDQLDIVLHELGRVPVTGVLYDLGVSSFQIDVDRRGFSYQSEGPLDMRMDQRQKLTAEQVLNSYSQTDLEKIIREYGEERHWRAIAQEIVRRRSTESLKKTKDLVEIVRTIVGERFLTKSLARVFQAVRIEVNQELTRLSQSLQRAYQILQQGGRLVVISYHSLEDRIVKNFMKEKELDCLCPPELPMCVCDKQQEMRVLTRKPLMAGRREVQVNPRSRSARMRVAEKVVPYRES